MLINPTKKDALWSFLGTALSMGANLIMLPFILKFLSDDAIGVYYIFVAISAITTLFDFGFSPAMARSVAYAWSGAESLSKTGVKKAKGGEISFKLLHIIISTCKMLYLILGLTALLLLLIAGTPYISFIIRNNPLVEYYIAWIIYVIAIFLNLLFGYYAVFLRGVGAVAEINKTTVAARLLQVVLCIGLLYANAGLIGVSSAYLLYGLSFRLFAGISFYRYKNTGALLKENNFTPTKEDIKDALKAIWPNAWKDGIVAVANYLLNQATTIISSLFLSLHMTGIFSLCVQMASAIAQISGTLYVTYQPALQSAYASRDTQRQKKYLSITVTSFTMLYVLGVVFLCICAPPLISIIRPGYEISIPILLGVAIYQFMLKFRNCYCTYISTTNRLIYCNAFLLSSLICVALSFLFTGMLSMGVWGLIVSQIISQAVYNLWKWPIFVHRELELSVIEMLRYEKREIFRLLGSFNKS